MKQSKGYCKLHHRSWSVNKTWYICTTYCLMKVSFHDELASGTFLHASAEALMIKSFTDSLILSLDRISFKPFLNLKFNMWHKLLTYKQTISSIIKNLKYKTFCFISILNQNFDQNQSFIKHFINKIQCIKTFSI